MNSTKQKLAAKKFVEHWTGKGYEKGESQTFWTSLLRDVLGVEHPEEIVSFESQVKLSSTSFIDAYIAPTKILVEQKSIDKDLRAPIRQSDGTFLTPFGQAKRYASELPLSRHPRYVVTCNFKSFLIYDMENPQGEPEEVLLENLEREFSRLNFLADARSEALKRELEVSIKAGELVGKIYDALVKEFGSSPTAEDLHSLNVLCVRLVFCLYAEDAGIFAKEQFYLYMKSFRPENMRMALKDLFKTLDTPEASREKFLEPKLRDFPYVNGSLFKEQAGETIPPIAEETARVLLDWASRDFDWSEISPTIFGAVFESTLNPETRRKGGMHYTSIENIHKVIDPLFMDDLRAELERIKRTVVAKTRNAELLNFQKKLGALKFLDPACGSGNFLTETYISLRTLENEALSLRHDGEAFLDVYDDSIFVKIGQFYGIEINDFAVTVAKTALWIAESQMMEKTSEILQRNLEFLPLKTNANIVEGNALKMDWEHLHAEEPELPLFADRLNIVHPKDIRPDMKMTVAEPGKHYDTLTVVTENVHLGMDEKKTNEKNVYDYIMGNPPFVGARLMSESQKSDVLSGWGNVKNIGNADYVSCWYKKAADLIRGTDTKCALVSTNSITQGEQVAIMWKPLTEQGIKIDFAYRTFRWDSESSEKAHVHCVIVGFSDGRRQESGTKFIIDEKGERLEAKNINGYLLDAPDIFVESRQKPLCKVPEIGIGNKPIDGGNYLFTEEEKDAFVKKEPRAEKYFRKWLGSDEFIHRYNRWCLWLGDADPAELVKIPLVMERVKAVREFRLKSKSAPTRKLAEKPTRFHVENMPKGMSILIPETSSERRNYIPMGFITPGILCSNAVRLIPNATLFHFGVLTSSVHMAWTRAVCGRLKSDYRYSKDIVYNNFPWPFIKETGDSGQETENRTQESKSSSDSKVPLLKEECRYPARPDNLRQETPSNRMSLSSLTRQSPDFLHCTQEQADKIEKTAQAILDARAKYPELSLAELYGESMFMFPELEKAHKENDRAVMQAYGFPQDLSESEMVARLFELYEKLTQNR